MKSFLTVLVGLMVALAIYTLTQDFRAFKIKEFIPPNPDRAVPERAVLKALFRQGYIPSGVFDRLRIENGIRVEETTYSTNEEFWKIINSDAQFDIALAPDYLVRRLDRLNRTIDINYSRLRNYNNLAPSARRSEELTPLFRCSVPYIFGTVGLGYTSRYIGSLPLKWSALFDPATPQLLRGRMGLIDDPRQSLGAALLALGKSPNSRNPSDVRAAGELIKDCMTHLARLSSDSSRHSGSRDLATELGDGHLYLTMAWGGDVARAMDTNTDLRFVSPDEGALLFFDCFVIMRTTKHIDAAEEFLDYMLRPEISAEVTNTSYFATLNAAATPYVSRILYNGPAYYIPRGHQLYFRDDLGDAEQLYTDVWNDVRAFYVARIKPTLDYQLDFGGNFVDSNDVPHPPPPKVRHIDSNPRRIKTNLGATAPDPAQ